MSKLTDRLTSKMLQNERKPQVQRGENAENVDSLDDYKKAFEDKISMELIFDRAEADGTLKLTQNGVDIVYRGEDALKDIPYFSIYFKDRFIGTPFVVSIASIDEDNKIVYVKSSRVKKGSTKYSIIGDLVKDVNKGQKPVVAGKVIRVDKGQVLIDILGSNILGICHTNDWAKFHVRYPREIIKEGEIDEFRVEEVLPKQKGKDTAFRLSHTEFTDDPWLSVPKEMVVGANILVKCIDKPNGKSYWWGSSQYVKNIEIMGDYTNKIGRVEGIMVGVVYKCNIVDVNPEKHIFKVAPFEVASPEVGNAIRFLRSKEKVE